MNTYKTSEVALIIGVHPNTVRLYEEWKLIPIVKRKTNGYRVFTDFHIEQFRLARLAFQVEVLQNGLRKKVIQMVKASATGDFDGALLLAGEYLKQIQEERTNAEEVTILVREFLSGETIELVQSLKRKEASEHLSISMDTLRNWEMNGLLTVKRKENGYRVYTEDDIRRIKIIRSLRCANYSLEAILHMFSQISENPNVDILQALNTPNENADIIGVCDKLITSLFVAECNAQKMIAMLLKMKLKLYKPST